MYVNYIRFVCTNCNTQRHLDSEQIEKRKRECHISPYLLLLFWLERRIKQLTLGSCMLRKIHLERTSNYLYYSSVVLIIGTDVALIAECLGLDPTGYKRSLAADENSSASCVVLKEQVSYYRGDILSCKNCSALKRGEAVTINHATVLEKSSESIASIANSK